MDPMAGGDTGMTDPSMDGADPNAAATMDDPNAMSAEGQDPMVSGDETPAPDQEGTGDSTMDIINQLSPTDREAVRAYAESMLSRDENNESAPNEEPAPQGQDVMMEITKGRLTKVQNRLNEAFGDMVSRDKKSEGDRVQKKVNVRKNNFKSPFDSPLD